MSRFSSFNRVCTAVLVVSALACSTPTGPVSKTRHDAPTALKTRHDGPVAVQGFGANSVTAHGVGTSPRPQP